MRNNVVDEDRWESLPSPEAQREEPAHVDSSPDTCVFGAASVRPNASVTGMPARVSLRAQAIVESLRPEALSPSTSPGPFGPVAGVALFDDDSEVSDVGVFRRSAILRAQGGTFPQPSRRAPSMRVAPTTTVVSPVRSRRAVAVVALVALLAVATIASFSRVQRAIRATADAVVTLLLAVS